MVMVMFMSTGTMFSMFMVVFVMMFMPTGAVLSMFMMVIIVLSIGLLNRIDPSKGERRGNW